MKKFIAPQVRIIRYDNNILCASREEGGSISKDPTDGDNQESGWTAPSRRIFGED